MTKVSRTLTEIKPSLIRRFLDVARRRPGTIDLTIGDPSHKTPSHVIEAYVRALREGKVKYSTSRGIYELREAIADKYRREYGLDYSPDEVVVTVGASEAIFSTIRALIDPGDEVLIPDPGFVQYEPAVRICHGKPIHHPLLEEKDYLPDVEAMKELISKRTRVIVMNTPCNPTGSVFTRDILKAIIDLAEDHDLIVVSDEVYEKFTYDGVTHECIATYSPERVIVINSFSKTYSMTGLRVGYLLGPRELVEHIFLIHFYNVTQTSTPAQYAALAALRGPHDFLKEAVELYDRNRKAILRALDRLRIPYVRPKGAYYVFPRIDMFGMSSMEFAKWLVEHAGVAVVPGVAFGDKGKAHVRISFSQRTDLVEEAAERLIKALEGFSKNR